MILKLFQNCFSVRVLLAKYFQNQVVVAVKQSGQIMSNLYGPLTHNGLVHFSQPFSARLFDLFEKQFTVIMSTDHRFSYIQYYFALRIIL